MTSIDVSVSNIGGIDELAVSLDQGVSLIAGPNASNKTSLLKSIAFAFGAADVPLRSGAEEGYVRLAIGDRTVERTARRTETGIDISGDTWIDNPENAILIDRFATLLETTPLRAAVSGDGDVEDLLKEPMNVDALEAERSRLLDQKRDHSSELEKLADVDERLADRKRELREQREHIAGLEDELEELYEHQETAADVDDTLQTLREERADLVSQREHQTAQVEELEEAIERFADRVDEMEAELEAARDEADSHDVDQLQSERARIESELEAVDDRIDVLQSVLTANREMHDSEFAGALGTDSGLMGDEHTCWTCGQVAEENDFDGAIEQLRELLERDKRRKAEHEPELESLTEQIEAAREAERNVRELEADRNELESRLDNRRESLEHNREALAETRERVDELDERIAEVEQDQSQAQSDVVEEIESTRVAIETSRRDIEQLEAACEELHKQQKKRDRLQAEIEEITAEIQTLTGRIEGMETHLREEFNTAMEELIEELAFDRIERVWLDGEFDLVIARSVDGSVREDALTHLAESEREMIGLVLCLAGFVTYDVADAAPVLLLDSLGAFDARRADRLLSYFAERTDLLLAAVHPKMAEELSFQTTAFGKRVNP